MKTLKSLILLLAIGLGLTACNSSFEENKKVNASPLPYGVFSLETNDADYAYKLIHTKSVATGVDMLYLLRETLNADPDENPYRIVIVGADSEGYDPSTGTLITTAEYSFYGDGLNNTSVVGGTLALISSPYFKKYQYSCSTENGKLNISGNAELVTDFDLPLLFGLWHNGEPENPADERVFVFDTEELAGLGTVGFMASPAESGVQYDYFTYSYDAAANQGTITFYEDENYAATTGLVYTFYFDDILSLVIVDENGNILTKLDPDASGSEPEPFSEVATGTLSMYYSGNGSTWYDLFEGDAASLFQSDINENHYQIEPFLVSGYPIDLTKVSATEFQIPSKYFTGYSNWYIWRWGDYSSAYANDPDATLTDEGISIDCLLVLGTSLYYCDIEFQFDANDPGNVQSIDLRRARNQVADKLAPKTYVINPAVSPINEQIARSPMSKK